MPVHAHTDKSALTANNATLLRAISQSTRTEIAACYQKFSGSLIPYNDPLFLCTLDGNYGATISRQPSTEIVQRYLAVRPHYFSDNRPVSVSRHAENSAVFAPSLNRRCR